MSYNLQIDKSGGGTGPWLNVNGFDNDSTETQATLSLLIEGQYYFFRYRARNVHGWSDFSPRMFVLMANIPDKLLPVQTVNNGLLVDIVWQDTPFDRNSGVFKYLIKVQRKDGSVEEHPECDGSDPLVIMTNRCSVSMLSLLSGNFLLEQGDPIRA